MQLSNRVNNILPSATLAITARAKELKSQGKDIIGMGVGEPDFDTPEHIKEAAIQAIRDGFTKYTAVDGTPQLRQAVINKFQRDNNLEYELDQVLVSCGGKQSFFNLTQALLNDGDEVIIQAPYWVSYPDIVKLAGGVPVIIETGLSDGFKLAPEKLAAAITDKTRLFVINSPSNPTGVAYTREDLQALADVLRTHPEIIIATDDMYEHILWTAEPFVNILNVAPDFYERTVVMNGVSKAYAMTGWRIGYAGGPGQLIRAMKKVQSQSTSNPTSISQVAAQAALEGDQHCIQPMLNAFKERHDYVYKRLNAMPDVDCLASSGTFYALPDVSPLLRKSGLDDVQLCEQLLNESLVATVPGSAFGAPGYIRLSYATSMENLEKALDRIEDFLGAI